MIKLTSTNSKLAQFQLEFWQKKSIETINVVFIKLCNIQVYEKC